MCGRFANHVKAMHGWSEVLGEWPSQAELGFNIAPSQMIPVFTANHAAAMRWGLIAPWLKEPGNQYSTFNARLSTVAEKPTFRHAWRSNQRCLIPALGYYEWLPTEGRKQPYFVTRRDKQPIMFGGLFEGARPEVPASCTILTRPAEGSLSELHHAMPVMFNPSHGITWFTGNAGEALDIAWRDYGPSEYEFYPVSPQVNKVDNQGAHLIQALSDLKSARPVSAEQQSGFDF